MKKLLCILIATVVILCGCTAGNGKADNTDNDTQKQTTEFQPLNTLSIPDTVSVVGLGEATHGNHEFFMLKLEVFQILVEEYGYRVFALEDDFGSCMLINEYIHTGNGTATDAMVNMMGVYWTQEFVETVEWMYEYNKSHQQDQISFFGFDMQSYDINKRMVLSFIEAVDADKLDEYTQSLVVFDDETRFDQTQENLIAGQEAVQAMLVQFENNKESYIASASKREYDIAYQAATCIIQCTDLMTAEDGEYTKVRDSHMAQNVLWLSERSKENGNGKIYITGHNGHIEKSSAAFAIPKSMGDYLSEALGEEYYAIGTDFYKNTFRAWDSSAGERKNFTITNKYSEISKLFSKTGLDIGLLDFAALPDDSAIVPLIGKPQSMGSVGDEFNSMMGLVEQYHTISMVPNEAYNAVILVQSATPVEPLPRD